MSVHHESYLSRQPQEIEPRLVQSDIRHLGEVVQKQLIYKYVGWQKLLVYRLDAEHVNVI